MMKGTVYATMSVALFAWVFAAILILTHTKF